MNKPLTMIIKETQSNLARVCNESGLPPAILELVIHGIYSELHSIVEKQAADEEIAYTNMIKNQAINDCDTNTNEGGSNESK